MGDGRRHRRPRATPQPQLFIKVDEREERQGPTVIWLPPSHTEDLEKSGNHCPHKVLFCVTSVLESAHQISSNVPKKMQICPFYSGGS